MAADSRVTPELLHETTKLLVTTQFGSQSLVQRKIRVGFATASQLLDELTARGILGPAEGTLAREVLYGPDQLDQALDRVNEQSGAHPGQAPQRQEPRA